MRPTRTSLVAAPLLLAALLTGMPAPAGAADATVTLRENFFSPQEVHVDPGDTVTWTHAGTRVHNVTSDGGAFASPDLSRGATFSHTFEKEGTYYYHCTLHGRAGKQGMWGVVVVGDPDPAQGRPRLDVPADFPTIQAAVDAAEPGSTIVVAPGRYRGDVRVTTDDLIVRGVDRYRTILDGAGERGTGILVEGASRVKIADLTVRGFTHAGVAFVDSTRFTAARVDAIHNGMHGVSATRSYEGVVRESFGWGSGEAAFYVADCMGCGVLLDQLTARANYAGYAGIDVTGVTLRRSLLGENGVGLVSLSSGGGAAPGRGTVAYANTIRSNTLAAPPPRPAPPFPAPFGVGVWLGGVRANVVEQNAVFGHTRYGIVVTEAAGFAPAGNTIARNSVERRSGWTLAWDGSGADNCFALNEASGPTSPATLQTAYACDRRPFEGTANEVVRADFADAVAATAALEPAHPGDPERPRCQRGRPGCHGH